MTKASSNAKQVPPPTEAHPGSAGGEGRHGGRIVSRALLGLFPFLVIIPHLIPLPDRAAEDQPPEVPHFKDDGKALPSAEQMDRLSKDDPIAFLQYCLRRHVRDVKGYTLTMYKQERVDGTLEGKELIDVSVREEPHSVLMIWKKGARKAARALYVAGENKDEGTGRSFIIVKPAGIAGRLVKSVTRDPKGGEASKSGRYPMSEFGLKMALERTLDAWKEAGKDLHVKCLGRQKVKELDGRECWVFLRDQYKAPELGKNPLVQTEQLAYVDVETWIMTGTTLKAEKGELIAEYWFRDIRLNPQFDKDVFTKKSIEN